MSTLDWVRAEKIYNLCEVLFKIHKVGFPMGSMILFSKENLPFPVDNKLKLILTRKK